MEVSCQLHSKRKNPWYSFYRRMGEPQDRSGCGGEEKKNPFNAPAGIRTPVVQLLAKSL
jgi:hypothetical protein